MKKIIIFLLIGSNLLAAESKEVGRAAYESSLAAEKRAVWANRALAFTVVAGTIAGLLFLSQNKKTHHAK